MTKRILTALLAALMALCAMTSCLAETPEAAPDMTQLCPAAPITLHEYREVFRRMMTEAYGPEFEQYADWQLVTLADGAVALANGRFAEGMYNIALTVEGSYVKSIHVAWPCDASDPQLTRDVYLTWCLLAAAPIPMRDGVPFEDAMNIAQAGLLGLVYAADPAEVHAVCGMQAEMGSTAGPDGALTMTYTFHREPEFLPSPGGSDCTGISAEGYMRALDDYAIGLTGEPLRWTQPEEWLGCTLIAVDSLGDSPALMIMGDRITLLTTLTPRLSDDPAQTYEYVKAMTFLTLVPVLTAQGMTEEEAIAAIEAWWLEAHFTARIVSAISGVPTMTSFYGFDVTVVRLEDGTLRLQLLTPLTEQIDFSQAE